MRLSPAERERRRKRAAEAPALIADGCKKIGAAYKLLDAGVHHYRITGPIGGRMDYWGGTGNWLMVDHPGIKGNGLESLLERIKDLDPTEGLSSERGTLVTIFADASYDHRTGAAGFGCWIKGGGAAITHGGPLHTVANSTDAELAALAEALDYAIYRGEVGRGRTVMLQSDCEGALSTMMKIMVDVTHSRGPDDSVEVRPARRLMASLANSPALDKLRRLQQAHDLKIVVRHVRGHQGRNHSGRSWVNSECDMLARRGRKEAEKQMAVRA